MCIAFLSFFQYEGYPLILLNNRDEQITRPTLPLHEWDSSDYKSSSSSSNSNSNNNNNNNNIKIYGGRDKLGGGTWLATNNKGKFCMVLNSYYKSEEYFLPQPQPHQSSTSKEATSANTTSGNNNNNKVEKVSRGKLVYDYLMNELITPLEYIEKIELNRNKFKPFMMVLGDINHNGSGKSYCYTSHYIPIDKVSYSSNEITPIINSISECSYKSLIQEIKKGTSFGIANYPISWDIPKVKKGLEMFNNNLKSIFNNGNNNNTQHQLNNENYESLLNIMLTETIENEINVPMENINVSSIFVPPYTSKFTNFIHSTVQTSLITFEQKQYEKQQQTIMNFIQIDNNSKEKQIISKPLN